MHGRKIKNQSRFFLGAKQTCENDIVHSKLCNVTQAEIKSAHQRHPLPEWFKIRPPTAQFERVRKTLKDRALVTVCEEAHCPNLSQCWSEGTATFMVLGDTCTRGCRFCAVKTGNPHQEIDRLEPLKLAQSIKKLALDYVVITMVARDDLKDGGAEHLVRCMRAIEKENSQTKIELLISDLRGDKKALQIVLKAKPVVLAHNIETVERLTKFVRDGRASYAQTLTLLRESKNIAPTVPTKSSVMLGLGETEAEIIQTMLDLRAAQVDILTLGQYLAPSSGHLPVREFITPVQFKKYESRARELGFRGVASGPLVRSSFRADKLYKENFAHMRKTA